MPLFRTNCGLCGFGVIAKLQICNLINALFGMLTRLDCLLSFQ